MNGLSWLDPAFSHRLVLALLHFLWQGTAIAAMAFLGDRLLARRSARARHRIHFLALLGMAACLPATFALIETPYLGEEGTAANSSRLHAEQALPVVNSAAKFDSQLTGMDPQITDPPSVSSEKELLRTGATMSEAVSPSQPVASHEGRAFPADQIEWESPESQSKPAYHLLLATAAPYVTLLYLGCVLVMILRLAKGVHGGRKLRSSASPAEDTELLACISARAKRMGLRIIPAIAYCERISVPIVVGIARPMILIPTALAAGLTPDQLETLITHELAHLRRHDPVIKLLQHFVEAILFFHPAVWYVSRRINVERENASDDLVVAAGWQRVHYADALVRMAELSSRLRTENSFPSPATLAASGHSGSDFKRRVMRLLNEEPSNLRLTSGGWILFLAVSITTFVMPLLVQAWARQPSPEVAKQDESGQHDGSSIGYEIRDFTLQDYLGAEYSLSDFADQEVVVVAFLGTECPLAKLYGPRLAGLAEKYESREVAFIGINSNQQDTPTELGHYARRHGVAFPLLKDPGSRIADRFGAERTPEVFVLDQDRKVRYRGQIDDQFGVGYARPEAKKHFLVDAIEDLLMGLAVRTSRTTPVGCHIGRIMRVAATGDITYTKQISRIMQRHCQECHREQGIAPFALDSYDAVAAWAETILEVVNDQRMPPWHANPKYGHFTNDMRMPEAEKKMLRQWVANGVPEGAASDLPPKREFFDGWALGKPDLVLTMPEPVSVPPTGVIDYQYVTIDPGFTEGKWIRASEIRPGVRSVVHHIIVFINPPGGDPILEERGVGFETVGGYVPGSPPMDLKDGVARYVPPGSTFVFQIHYTPDGTERSDRSQIGLYFANPNSIRHTMQTGVAVNLNFEIPPGADNHRVEAAHRISHDMEIHSLAPHMHYRGKSFRIEATYPNGSREILLDVPRYDFNWQNAYTFVRPKFMPEGTLLRCVAYFDNSEGNLSNPDPTATVRWGEQTWEEMMIGYFEGVYLNQDLSLSEPRLTSLGNGTYRARFAYKPDRHVQSVNLAGTFNEWNNTSHPLEDPDGDGVYTAEMVVPQGAYRYKFVVDGNYWTHDPASRILTGFLHESFFVAGRE